eukprot:TRINITY_DN113406_c0_g1_i1.p3 TRINITY_DN113406_c0_g1~~TRINITY_DN113406_c0_g1_i1.p3  ORF type:complete len:132 (+),score=22.63 TRINITY_DN113406_c0_g1_i1:27-398(+)
MTDVATSSSAVDDVINGHREIYNAARERRGKWVILMNNEEQYCVFPAEIKYNENEWKEVQGLQPSKDEALALVEKIWTNMTPKSLRKYTEKQTPNRNSMPAAPATLDSFSLDGMGAGSRRSVP